MCGSPFSFRLPFFQRFSHQPYLWQQLFGKMLKKNVQKAKMRGGGPPPMLRIQMAANWFTCAGSHLFCNPLPHARQRKQLKFSYWKMGNGNRREKQGLCFMAVHVNYVYDGRNRESSESVGKNNIYSHRFRFN